MNHSILKSVVLAGILASASTAMAQVSGTSGTGGRGIDTAAVVTTSGGANPGVSLIEQPKGGNPIAGVRDFFAKKSDKGE